MARKWNEAAVFIAVFCTACATLALELVQTRVLSALFYNHVVYLTVTIALMGFGISGVLVSILSKKLASPDKWAAAAMGTFGISSFLCLRAASFAPVLFEGEEFLSKLPYCYGVLVIPYLFAGTALGLIFMAHGRNIYRLYFTDLAASALGAVGFTFLLRPLGGDAFIWLCSAVTLAGFVVYGSAIRIPRAALALAIAVTAGCACWWGLDLVNDRPEPYKTSAQVYLPERTDAKVERSEWTTIAKTDLLSDPVYSLISWQKDPFAPNLKMITQDGDAFTVLPGNQWVRQIMRQGRTGRQILGQNLGYLIRRRPKEALVIGTGGGIDIISAQAYGAQHITGIEINPATHDLLLGPYRDYVEWPNWTNVTPLCAEGRNYIARAGKQFDTIMMSGIDTFSALSSGAYVLSENYLYTVEAMEDYLNALKPDGIMTIFRWLFLYPRESLRLANLFLAAAERMGIEEPSKCIMIIAVDFKWKFRWASTIIRRTPFTPEEVKTILLKCREQEEISVVYVPDVFDAEGQSWIEGQAFDHDAQYMAPAREAFGRLIRARTAAERRAFEDEYAYNITPVYDDRPFFFEYHKASEKAQEGEARNQFGLRGTFVHYVLHFLFVITGAAAFLSMIVPLFVFAREGLRVKGLWSLLAFFASLGVGFMFIELGFIQRLSIYLGHPMHSLAVVLAGLLLFTGIGSYLTGKRAFDPGRLLKRGMIGTAVLALAWLGAMGWIIPRTLGWPIAARIAVTLVSILPVGLHMGMPFATGVRYLEGQYPRFIPWAWGVNGLTSVMASILAILLAMRIGFTIVVVLGSLVYLLGLAAASRHLRAGWHV